MALPIYGPEGRGLLLPRRTFGIIQELKRLLLLSPVAAPGTVSGCGAVGRLASSLGHRLGGEMECYNTNGCRFTSFVYGKI